jgi:hypothetical protein
MPIHTGDAMVRNNLIQAVACGLSLRPLVGESLLGGAHPGGATPSRRTADKGA